LLTASGSGIDAGGIKPFVGISSFVGAAVKLPPQLFSTWRQRGVCLLKTSSFGKRSLQYAIYLFDGRYGRKVAAGFYAAEGFHANAGEFGKLFLVQSGFHSIADDATGDGGAAELHGRIITLSIRIG